MNAVILSEITKTMFGISVYITTAFINIEKWL
jgi:hypothetical protein